MTCSYCDAPAVYAITTSKSGVIGKAGEPDERLACEEHEMQARIDALRGATAQKEDGNG